MTAIYALPAKPTARDIIERSIIAHPSLFREALIAQATMHDNYARLATDRLAARGAAAMASDCLSAYDAVGMENPDAICERCGTMVVALNVAAKLQCLPPHMKAEAAAAWETEA